MSSNKEKRRPKPTPFFGRCSVTANPDKTNRCWLPTWTYAVVPIATVIPMGMIMVVVMIVVMVMIIIVRVMFMIVIVRVMFMIVIVIMPLIVTLLLMTLLLMTLLLMTLLLIVILLMTLLLMTLLMIVTLLLMTLLLVVTVIVIFSEGRYRKRQSTYYRADEREFANHLVSLVIDGHWAQGESAPTRGKGSQRQGAIRLPERPRVSQPQIKPAPAISRLADLAAASAKRE